MPLPHPHTAFLITHQHMVVFTIVFGGFGAAPFFLTASRLSVFRPKPALRFGGCGPFPWPYACLVPCMLGTVYACLVPCMLGTVYVPSLDVAIFSSAGMPLIPFQKWAQIAPAGEEGYRRRRDLDCRW